MPVKHTFPLQLGNDMITSVGHYLKVSECLGLADKIVSPLSMTVNLGWKLVWYQRTMASGQPGRRTGRKSWILLGKNMISLKKGFFLIAITRNSALQSKNSLLVLHSLFSTLMILLWCSAKKKKSQYILLCICCALGNSGFKCFVCRSSTNKVCLFGFNLVHEYVCDFPFLHDQWSLQHPICFTFQVLQARVVWERRWLSPASP